MNTASFSRNIRTRRVPLISNCECGRLLDSSSCRGYCRNCYQAKMKSGELRAIHAKAKP
jgi:hypothetical protein